EHDRRVGRQVAEAELRRHRADSIQSDAVGQPRGRGVERLAERELERDVAEEAVAIVIRRPAHVAVLPGEGRVLDIGSRQELLRSSREGLVEGREVGNRLEDRTGLTFGLSNAIELARAVVAATGHRANLSALRFESDEARLEALLRLAAGKLGMLDFQIAEIVRDCALGELFHVHIERGEDAQTLAAEHLRRITLGQFLLDEIDEVGGVVALGIDFPRMQRLADRRIVSGFADVPILEHRGQDLVAAWAGGVGMVQRIEPVGRTNQAGNSSHFANSQIARLLREVVLRRFPDAVYPFLSALTQVDIVNIVLQDFILGVLALRDVRHHRFLELALVASLAGQEEVLPQVLGERRAALAHVPRDKIDIRGLDGAHEVNAVMLVKAMVFGGQDGIDHRGRNLAQAHEAALLPFAFEDAADEFGFQLDREDRFMDYGIAHRRDRISLKRQRDEFAAEVAVGIRETMQKDVELAALAIEAVLAASGDVAGIDGMVIQARETLEEAEVLEILAGVNEHRVGINARRDVPSLAREARDDFILELIVVAEEQPQGRRDGEQDERARADQREFQDSFRGHRECVPGSGLRFDGHVDGGVAAPDEQQDYFALGADLQRILVRVDVLDGHAIDLDDHVASVKARLLGAAAGLDRRNHDAAGRVEPELFGEIGTQVLDVQAEGRDGAEVGLLRFFFRRHDFGLAGLRNRDRQIDRLLVANHLENPFVAEIGAADQQRQFARVADRLIVERDDYVAALDAGYLGWSAVEHLGNQRAA